MLRRHARQRRELLRQKTLDAITKKTQAKKNLIADKFIKNEALSTGLQKEAVDLFNKRKYDVDDIDCNDDEYKYAAVADPKIMITTSHEPSSRLKMFVKELSLILPSAQRLNRGKYEIKSLMHACRSNNVTDLIIVHEHRGNPDNLVICHLPHGPTAYFNISDVVMRHDIPNLGPMSEQKPHLVFHNFKTQLAERVQNILKYLFPVPKKDSQRVITFANHDDYISFRHHTYKYVDKVLQLKEVGPRFQLRLYQIKLGTLDNIKVAQTEWVYRPYMNTTKKRRFLSDDDGWVEEQQEEE